MSSNQILVFTCAEHRGRPSSEPEQEFLIPAVIMSKKKGMSLEDKRKTIVGIYHSTASGQILAFAGRDTDIQVIYIRLPTSRYIRLPTSRDPLLMHSSCLWLYTMCTQKDVYNLKEIESAASKLGVVQQSVKDVNQVPLTLMGGLVPC
jgi:hypothetical protein